MARFEWPPRVTLHRSSGQGRVRLDGKTHYLGRYNTDEMRRRYAELVQRLAPRARKESQPTVGEVARRWQAERGPSYTPKELANYADALAVLTSGGRGSLPADRMTTALLGAVRRDMLSAGWCRNVTNRQTTRVRTVWRWAEEQGLAPPGSWAHLRALRPLLGNDRAVRHTEPVRAAEQADVEAVAAEVRDEGARAMLWVQWWSACRAGEARSMKAGEIDRSGEVWLYRPASHKGSWRGHAKVVPLGPEAQKILTPLLEGKGPRDVVFKNRWGRSYTDTGYASLVHRAAVRAARPWFKPLSVRHGARVRITRECGLDAARFILGHTSTSMSLHYGKGADVQVAVDAARRCG